MNWFLFVYLWINTWTDCRKKVIDLRVTAGYLLILFIGVLLCGCEWSMTGILPGTILCVISVFQKGKVGSGDGIVLACVGATLGPVSACRILWNGCILVCVWWMIKAVLLRKRKKEFPFAPFLLLGYGIELYLR